MRRFSSRQGLAVCVALGALSLTAACSDDAKSGDTPAAAATPATGASAVPPAPVDPAVAASADAALSGNTKQICTQAGRTSTSFGELFVADLKLQIDTSKDPAAKQKAIEKTSRDVENFSSALADMAGLTTDATLKKALTEMSAQVKALKGDVTKINTDKMAALTAKLDKACAKG